MRRARNRLVLPLLATLVFAACGGQAPSEEPAAETAPESAAPTREEIDRARALYDGQACATCHGENAEGIEGAGPALRDLRPYWDVERLMGYLEDPRAFREENPDFEERRDRTYDLEMPAFDTLSDEERRLLARWLLTR
jgi:mono/diheme cytochrome c family protein